MSMVKLGLLFKLYIFFGLFTGCCFSDSFKGSIFFNPPLSGPPYFTWASTKVWFTNYVPFRVWRSKNTSIIIVRHLTFCSFSYKHTVAFSREYVISHLVTDYVCCAKSNLYGQEQGSVLPRQSDSGGRESHSFGCVWSKKRHTFVLSYTNLDYITNSFQTQKNKMIYIDRLQFQKDF